MKIQRFRPANGTLLVLRDEIKEKKSEGGIIYADRAVELANQGEVRASETGCQYQVGDRVVFTKYAGSEFELNGILYLLLREKEIQGCVETLDVPDSPSAAHPQSAEDVNAAAQAALAMLEKQATA